MGAEESRPPDESCVIIWTDSSIEVNDQSSQNTLAQLGKIVKEVITCKKSAQCIDWLNGMSDKKALVVCSGNLGENLVTEIHDMANVIAIYIFCGNKARHEMWAGKWTKIGGVFTSIEPICESIKEALSQGVPTKEVTPIVQDKTNVPAGQTPNPDSKSQQQPPAKQTSVSWENLSSNTSHTEKSNSSYCDPTTYPGNNQNSTSTFYQDEQKDMQQAKTTKTSVPDSFESVDSDKGAVPFLAVDDDSGKIWITDTRLIQESKSFVGFVGAPGAGKSSLCNTVVYCQHNIPARPLFEPSDHYESFTKGLWILSPKAKRLFKSNSDWEVLDMEGFQYKSEACWKMAMVLSTLVEVAVFCNRNARADVLLDAAEIFAKGMRLSKTLSMSPVTKQVFIQVHSAMFEKSDQLAAVIRKVREILQSPEIEVSPFCIPEVTGCDMRKLPFHPQIVEAVQNLLKQFRFGKDSQAAAAKATQLETLLDAFNKGDFTTCDKLGLHFLKMDSERIYKHALAEHREKHETLASKLTLTSVDTTITAFMGQPDWCLDLRFKTSPYYVEKYERNLQEWYPSDKRSVKMLEIYERHYKSKMESLKDKLVTEELEREAKASRKKAEEAMHKAQQDDKEAEEAERLGRIAMQNEYQMAFRRLINAAIEAAKEKLGRKIAELEKKYRPIYSDDCFKSWELFIDKTDAQKYAREKNLSTQPDWSPFETYYKNEKMRIKNAWNAQIERAKWKEPVKAMGELKCENAHVLTDDVCCGKDECDGKLFWIDGPNRMVICINCSDPQTIGNSLICSLCKAKSNCVTRPTNYMP